MALKDFAMWEWPQLVHPCGHTSYNTNQVDGATEYFAPSFSIPKTGSLTHFGIRSVGATDAQILKCELMTVSANAPSGTLYGGSTKATLTPTANAYLEFEFGTPASATAGDIVCAKVSFDNTVGNVQFRAGFADSYNVSGFPVIYYNAGSTSRYDIPPMLVIKMDEKYICPPGCSPFLNGDTGTDANTSGLKFQIPNNAKLVGARMSWNFAGTHASYTVKLFAADGTTVLSTSGSIVKANMSISLFERFISMTPVELTKDTTYYLAVVPASGSLPRYKNVCPSATVRADVFGTNVMWSANAGAGFVDETTSVASISGIFTEVDNVTAGGLITHPGMAGGMRG